MSLTEAPSCLPERALSTQHAEPKRHQPPATPVIAVTTGSDPQPLPPQQEMSRNPSREHLLLEANEITFKVGNVVLTMTQENGGTLEIRAPHIRIQGEDVTSEAENTNSVVGGNVVTEAKMHSDVLGKLIRIDGQFVKINS